MDSSKIAVDAPASQVVQQNIANGVKDVLAEILEWSKDRPRWQRDALRRLLVAGGVSPTDIQELTELCKSAHGLSQAKGFEPLTEEHLAIKGQQTATVSLTGVTHHCGVNALASEQTVTFGPNLTIAFGWNAAGKSGYARILKRACRSRGVENILGNVLIQEAPLKPKVTIRYAEGAVQVPLDWTPDTPSSEALARVSVFDAHSAPVYLRDKTDVAFRPYGLDIFDKLSSICGDVRARLQDEQEKLNRAVPVLPTFPAGTGAKAMVDELTGLTSVEHVLALGTLSPVESQRLKALREQQRDFHSADPKQRARELKSKSERVNSIANHLEQIGSALDTTRMATLRKAADDVRAAREAVVLLQKTAITPDLLPGTGGDSWKKMWEATGEFSHAAKPGTAFPPQEGPCPFCQQPIGRDAAARLQHFAEYVSSEAQGALTNADLRFNGTLSQITGAAIERSDISLALNEMAGDDPELTERVRQFLANGIDIQNAVKNGAKEPLSLPTTGIGAAPIKEIRTAVVSLQRRARQLETAGGVFDPKLAQELAELESRLLLSEQLGVVLGEIERKKRLSAYRECIEDTATQQITRKSTDLTKELVTDQLRTTFQDELKKLEFKHLAIEIEAAGGAKGSLFHHLVFPTAPGISVMDVLSEGECRTLSLAAFLTELSTATSRSAIIFDDPVSSLDHVWRERIARRLVAEAKTRQVIVFTHDLLFLRLLLNESEKQGIHCENQYIRRDGQAGMCSPDLPWIAMPVKERIGKLRVQWQAADKTSRTMGPEAFEREARDIYGLLREAWEQGVSEVLLNDVVERYRPSIETQKLRFLHDITEVDLAAVEDAMTFCSRWMRGHDHPAADGTPFPDSAMLKKRIDDLEAWVKALRQRRK